MAEEQMVSRSKVRVVRDGGLEDGPRHWVYVLRPGSSKEEEYSQREFMGMPSDTEEDRLIKQEVQRQFRALEKQVKEAMTKAAPDFEVLNVVMDRSPADDSFNEARDITVYYHLEGREQNDSPSSLSRMIRSSPDRFPEGAALLISTAIREKMAILRAQRELPEADTSESKIEDLAIHAAKPKASADVKEATQNDQIQKPGPTTLGTDASTMEDDRPHPDSIEGAMGIYRAALGSEDEHVPVAPRHAIKMHELRKEDDGELFISVEIDGERDERRYNDLEAEIGDHAEDYPPMALGMLQDKKRVFLEPKDAKSKGTRKPNVAALYLVEMAKQGGKAEFFHDEARTPFARVWRNDHFEVLAVKERGFADWLIGLSYDAEGLAPEEATMKRAIATLAVLAIRGEERPVYLRHGEHDGAFYYDLCNDQWQAIRITAEGCEIMDDPPVMFRRHDHMRPQVMPIPPTGKPWALKELVKLANIGTAGREVLEIHLILLNVPLIEQMGAGTLGPEGTGKTTTQQLAVRIDGPSTDAESSLPKSKNDLSLHLSTHSLASFDNLTRITEEQSDDLSRAGTGATDTMRALYKDNDINRRRYRTPCFFNGISVTGAKPDFYDRNLIYCTLETFDGPRLSKRKLLAKMDELLPYALGEVFDILSKAMGLRAEFSEETEDWTPRMVDWYLWALAIAKATGRSDGWFKSILKQMVDRRDYDAIADQPLTRALEDVAAYRGFVGTAAELYAHLNCLSTTDPNRGRIDISDRNWPTSAVSLGIRIKPLIRALRSHGVYIYKRPWTILKNCRVALKHLLWVRMGIDIVGYRDSDDLYIISDKELDLGRDGGFEPPEGGK